MRLGSVRIRLSFACILIFEIEETIMSKMAFVVAILVVASIALAFLMRDMLSLVNTVHEEFKEFKIWLRDIDDHFWGR